MCWFFIVRLSYTWAVALVQFFLNVLLFSPLLNSWCGKQQSFTIANSSYCFSAFRSCFFWIALFFHMFTQRLYVFVVIVVVKFSNFIRKWVVHRRNIWRLTSYKFSIWWNVSSLASFKPTHASKNYDLLQDEKNYTRYQ